MKDTKKTENKSKEKTTILQDIFASTGDGKASISKISMVIGLLVGSYVVINQAYNGGIAYDIFAIYMMCTLGANSVNKAISVIQHIKDTKYSNQYQQHYSPDYSDQNIGG